MLTGLLAAWLGGWGTWLAHPTAGLTQTAVSLAQFSQRLPDVLYGKLGSMPDLLYVSLAMAALALNIAVRDSQSGAIRWTTSGLTLLLIVRMVPPYPDLLQLWQSPFYGRQFVVATLALLGWAVTLTAAVWSEKWRSIAALLLSLSGMVGALRAQTALQRAMSASTELNFSPGWGLVLYTVGLLVAIAAGVMRLRHLQPSIFNLGSNTKTGL